MNKKNCLTEEVYFGSNVFKNPASGKLSFFWNFFWQISRQRFASKSAFRKKGKKFVAREPKGAFKAKVRLERVRPPGSIIPISARSEESEDWEHVKGPKSKIEGSLSDVNPEI